MRAALVVTSGLATLAALAGAFKGLVTVLTTILLGTSEGYGGQIRGASPYLLLWGGTEAQRRSFASWVLRAWASRWRGDSEPGRD